MQSALAILHPCFCKHVLILTAHRFFVQIENMGDLQCSNVVATLQLSWPGLSSLTEQSQLGSFTAVSNKPLTGTNATAVYSLKGVLIGGQVAALTFTGTVTDSSVGSTVTMNTAGMSDEGPVDGDSSTFTVPLKCGCDLVYDYSFDTPPCIGRRVACVLALHTLTNIIPCIMP